jgi:hypothetical protein
MKKNLSGIIFSRLKYFKQKLTCTKRYKLTKSTLEYLNSPDCTLPEQDRIETGKFLDNFLIMPISYCFSTKYLYRNIKVYKDITNGLPYLFHNNHKLYFKRGMKKSDIVLAYNYLCMEQDENSPHSYNSFNINYQPEDIAVDAGAAEGIWGLDIIDRIERLFMFECDESWIEALEATYAPWKEKVCIVKKYVSDTTDSENISLDDYFSEQQYKPTVLKADIEGCEKAMLDGAERLQTDSFRHILLCTYHRENDYEILKAELKKHHFIIETSKGYLLWIHSDNEYFSGDAKTIFRKALIYGKK